MSNQERFMGRIFSFSPVNNTLMLKIDFITPEQQEIIEQLTKDQNLFTFYFKKPYRENKAYHQLKYYYKMLKKILIKCDVFPDSANLKSMNEEIMKTLVKCDYIGVDGNSIPVVVSKSNFSYEEMENLNKLVEERYEKYLDNIREE